MTGPHSRLIHELVEQSRERVAHIRAGQSLAEVYCAQHNSLPPAAAALARYSNETRRVQHQASDASGLHTTQRKRAAVALAPVQQRLYDAQVPAPTSYEQYAFYTGSKPTQSENVSMMDRRKAITSSSKQLSKLATIVARREVAAEPPEPAASILLRAVAVIKSKNAFLKLKHRDRGHAPEDAKNTHMAFLEFKASATIPKSSGDMAKINTSTREPIRYGDAVCLLSMASNLPLAIGRNGRAVAVVDTVTGPHMVFTIVDFCNPSRRDDVLVGDDFWIRVDAHQLDVSDEDKLLSLLVDTQFYLGGPGTVNENGGGDTHLPTLRAKGAALKYADGAESGDREQQFKLVAMKATVPSAEYYGDDLATREYAMETNPSILRLAKWRFTPVVRPKPKQKSKSHQDCEDHDSEANGGGGRGLLLNCESVYLMQGEFALEFDSVGRHAVLRGSLGRVSHHQAKSEATRQRRESRAWQVRLLRRGSETPGSPKKPSKAAVLPGPAHQKKRVATEQESLEWLQFHTDRVARDTKRLQAKLLLANDAHRAYDRVAAQSNAKLLQIEKSKALHHHECFQSRFQAALDDKSMSKRAVVLPRVW